VDGIGRRYTSPEPNSDTSDADALAPIKLARARIQSLFLPFRPVRTVLA